MRHTDLIVILDRSGSMSGIARDMEGGFDTMMREQAKEEGSCNVTLVQFDSESIDTVYSGRRVGDVPPLHLVPRGGTPLLQAIGHTINKVSQQISVLPTTQKPEQVIFLIITDGQENTPREFTTAQIKSLIESKTKEGWSFVYLGANVDAFAESGAMGIPVYSAAPYEANARGVRAMYSNVSASLSTSRRQGTPVKLTDFTNTLPTP